MKRKNSYEDFHFVFDDEGDGQIGERRMINAWGSHDQLLSITTRLYQLQRPICI